MRSWVGSTIALGLLAGVAGSLGCGPAASYRLPPTSGSPDIATGELTIAAQTDVHHVPTVGWDLEVQLTFDWRGQERSRVDLARALVRVDGVAWDPCRPPDGVDRDGLLVLLEPGAHTTTTLKCRDIPQPTQSLELRVHATGTGAPGGYVDLNYLGVDQAQALAR